MRIILLTCIACCGLSAPLPAQSGPDATGVLKRMHDASGGAAWDRAAEIVEYGQMVENGFTGQFTQGEDLKTGSYAFRADFPAADARIGAGVHGDEIWTLNQQGDLAGLQVGDLITKIDGKPPDDNTDESVFQRPVGTVLHLTVMRAGNAHEVAVTLKDVL